MKEKVKKRNPSKVNIALLEKQNKLENQSKIETLWASQALIYSVMETCDDVSILRSLDMSLQSMEFALQGLWGFPMDIRFHRFWERPKCGCPRMDNEDRWGTGTSVRNLECILHGIDGQE